MKQIMFCVQRKMKWILVFGKIQVAFLWDQTGGVRKICYFGPAS